MSVDLRNHLALVLKEKGCGNILRGWRRELDPDSSLTCGYQEFCRAAEHFGFHEDIAALFAIDGDSSTLNFSDVAPEENRVLQSFKEWIKANFTGPADWFEVVDPSMAGLDQEAFIKHCHRRGFSSWNQEPIAEDSLRVLFDGIDLNNCGQIHADEIPFLELDDRVREQELFALKQQKIEEERSRLTKMLEEGRARASKLSPGHRLAQRPWQEVHYEHLPAVVMKKRAERQSASHKKKKDAHELFMHHLQSTYGNEVRAWRRGLDPHCSFALTEQELFAYCRRIDFKGDLHALWPSLDRDGDGLLAFEELCLRPADVLANFRTWVRSQYGHCVHLWEQPALKCRRSKTDRSEESKSWVSNKKMLFHDLRKAFVEIGFPHANSKEHMRLILTSLDLYGCGFISLSDFQWLDSWRPAEWLCSSPDKKAWLELRDLLKKKYGHLLHAWRSILDTDGSNRVSWGEFKAACEKCNFKGDNGGAWRFLDADLSGSISLQEVDPAGSELLYSFKSWAEKNFGSVRIAFQALDVDGGGTLSFSEMRRACRKWKWDGEVRLLFDCLDLDSEGAGRRQLSVAEIGFLDDWEPDLTEVEDDKDRVTIPASAARPRSLAKTQKTLSQPQLPSLHKSTMVIHKNPPKVFQQKYTSKKLCQTFKCPQLIKAKPSSNTPTWLDRLWLASRENRDNGKSCLPGRPSLLQVSLPDVQADESTKAAEDARMATEALKAKVGRLTIFSAAREEECITGGYLALQFDLKQNPDHDSHRNEQRTMKLGSPPPLAALPPI